jgi:hypothetical protein
LHEIKLNELADDKALTQAVVQITQMLGMYQAELARVLGLQCADIGDFASGKKRLQTGSTEWAKARQFVTLYERLYQHFGGDAVAMYHWLRTTHPQLAASPLLLMVDEGRLDAVVAWFDTAATWKPQNADKEKH